MLMEDFIEKEQFHHSYQPLFSLDEKRVIGNEILLRAETGSPIQIFEQAKRENKLFELDTKSIYKALHTFCSEDSLKDDLLFINIFPSTLIDKRFPDFLNKVLSELPNCVQKVVFELNENESIDQTLFIQRIQMIKDYGFLIAIDDVGKGWSSLMRIIELEPEYIKLDFYFSQSLATSRKKQIMIKSILKYCELNNIKIILEGIEMEDDLKTAKSLGVHYGQGYYLCKPVSL